jgi:hypothetical protein
MLMVAKLFTPAEANRTLPLVRTIVADILERARELRDRAEEPPSAGEDEERELIQKDIVRMMQEIEALGATFKDWDFELGLVDFPARIDGRDVYLCWRSNEDRVAWFHARDEGYAGRRPIPDELLDD